METINTITALISNIGFPIVCVIFLWKYISTTQKEFTEAIRNNTAVTEKLCEKIDDLTKGGEHDEKDV